jgi:hypothetical protein
MIGNGRYCYLFVPVGVIALLYEGSEYVRTDYAAHVR